jgi:hypothetical protein
MKIIIDAAEIMGYSKAERETNQARRLKQNEKRNHHRHR